MVKFLEEKIYLRLRFTEFGLLEKFKMAKLTTRKSRRHDSGIGERFMFFKKEDFEADWVKVSEGKFGHVYKVKLKLWREKCAIKAFISSSDYRYGYTVTVKHLIDFHLISFI